MTSLLYRRAVQAAYTGSFVYTVMIQLFRVQLLHINLRCGLCHQPCDRFTSLAPVFFTYRVRYFRSLYVAPVLLIIRMLARPACQQTLCALC